MDKFIVSLPKSNKKRNISKISSYDAKTSMTTTSVTKAAKSTGIQMFLDVGQKTFGASRSCKSCGMHYIIGDIDDEKRHHTHCQSNTRQAYRLPSLTGLTIVKEFDGDDRVIKVQTAAQMRKIFTDTLINEIKDEMGSSIEFVSGLCKSSYVIVLYRIYLSFIYR